MSEAGRVQSWTEPWLGLPSGKRIYMGNGYPPHLSPCRECGRLLRDADPDDVCGACLGSVCDA